MNSNIHKAAAIALGVLLGLQADVRAQDAEPATSSPAPVEDATQQEAVAADPAVWGPYAKLVGRTFAGETLVGSKGYASATRSIQWEVPGEVMLETGIQANGTELPQMRILPAGPGRLEFDVKAMPNSTGQVADAGSTLRFDLPFGWENLVQLVDDDSYEMKTLKRGELQSHAVYRDVTSAAQQERAAEQASEKVEAREAARIALREEGIPDTPMVDVPVDRVLAYQEPVRGPSGTLRISRAKAWEGSACYAAVYINGRWAARLDEQETATFNVPAGQVRVGVSADPQGRGACRLGQATEQTHETVLSKGEALHVQISLGGQTFREALVTSAP